MTDSEHQAFSAEFRARNQGRTAGPQDLQRLREFRAVFKPEGAMADAFEREAENKALYNQLQMSSVGPVAAPSKTCLTEEKPDGAPKAHPPENAPASPAQNKRAAKPRQRSAPPSSFTASPRPLETSAVDALPDFDVF